MGWNIGLSGDEVTQEQLQEAIQKLPARLQGFGSHHGWGWSLACDVTLREGQVMCSGAGFSAAEGEEVAFRLGKLLHQKVGELEP